MTNKFSRFTVLMALNLSVLFFSSFQTQATVGDAFVIDNLKYTVLTEEDSTRTVEVKRNEDISGSMAIPDSVENNGITYSVTFIGDYAFSDCSNLTSITIPDSVTSIGERSFFRCRSLTSITIPDSVTSIGRDAFSSCSSLTSIEIPDSLTSIGDWAFSSCSSLTSIEIPDSVTSIGHGAFSSCSSLTSIEIPDSVTSIGHGAFFECDQLPSILFSAGKKILVRYSSSNTDTSYVIPDTVTYIAGSAFYNCSSLTSIEIPDSVTSIGDRAFSSCSSLTSIEIPDGLTSIGSYAFSRCSSLTSITIPDSVTSIEHHAFAECNNLTNVTIGNGVTSIGEWAFSYCNNLTNVTIGNGVTSIGEWAFSYSSLSSITIPDNVTSIEHNAFIASGITSAIIGKGVKYIGTGAFSSGVSLYFTGNAPINIGSGLGIIYYLEGTEGWNDTLSDHTLIACKGWNIVNHVIYVCKSKEITAFVSGGYSHEGRLNGIIIEETVQIGTDIYPVTSIAAGAFLFNVMNIIIPNSIKFIGEHAFRYGCKLYFEGDIPDDISLYIFGDVIAYNSFIYYIEGTKGWDDFKNDNDFINGQVERESRFVFCKGCKGWSIIDQIIYVCKEGEEIASVSGNVGNVIDKTDIVILDVVSINSKNYPVDIIEDNAFWGCDKLRNVIIPEGVKSIGVHAFYYCESLAGIEMPDSVNTIETEAFLWCYNLKNIIIGCGIKTIGKNAFFTSASTSPLIKMNVYFRGDFPKDCNLSSISTQLGQIYIYYLENAEGFDKIQSSFGVCCKGWSIVDGIIYVCKQNEDASSVTGFIGTPTDVTIQDIVNINMVDYPVIGICLKPGNSAFYNCKALKSIIIPDSVTSIGWYAFYDCRNLTSIYFEGNAPSLGRLPFYNTPATIYYREGTEGWTNPWGERSTALWVEAPEITEQPQSQSAVEGNDVTFTVSMTGTAPLSYQWQKDGVDIIGATDACYTVDNVKPTDAGSYRVIVSNSAGSVTSDAAVLTVRYLGTATISMNSVNPVTYGASCGDLIGMKVSSDIWGSLLYNGQEIARQVFTSAAAGKPTGKLKGGVIETDLLPAGTEVTLQLAAFDQGYLDHPDAGHYYYGISKPFTYKTGDSKTIQPDGNLLFDSFTIEWVETPVDEPVIRFELEGDGESLMLDFGGTLYESDDAINWRVVEGAKAPFKVDITHGRKFYRCAQ